MEEEKNNNLVQPVEDEEQGNFFTKMINFSLQKFLGRMRVAEKKTKLYEQEIEDIDKTRKTAIIRSFIRKTKNI